MINWHTLIPIPNSIIQEAIDAWIIQMKWSAGSVESRSRDVERIEHHLAEIVIAVIQKEVQKYLRLK